MTVKPVDGVNICENKCDFFFNIPPLKHPFESQI